jgi:ParB family transcriptional regulator, chromosome partitioning protein
LLDLLAVASAHTVDAVREKRTPEDAPALLHAEQLAGALKLDMVAWFTPTAASYFGRVNRAFIVEALTEAKRPVRTRAWSKMKKGELAALAECEIAGTGRLPQPLRPIAVG